MEKHSIFHMNVYYWFGTPFEKWLTNMVFCIYLQFPVCLHGINKPSNLPSVPCCFETSQQRLAWSNLATTSNNPKCNCKVDHFSEELRIWFKKIERFISMIQWKSISKKTGGISTCEQFLGATFGWFKEVWWQPLLFGKRFSLSWSLFWRHQD